MNTRQELNERTGKEEWVINVDAPYRLKKGFFKKSITEQDVFIVPYFKAVTCVEFAKRACLLPNEIIGNSEESGMLNAIASNIEEVIYLAGITLHNHNSKVPKDLLKYIRENLSIEDLSVILSIGIDALGLEYFLAAITLCKGTVRILKPDEVLQS
ncbi:hypothetical protein [Pedobacter sp. Leaf170]|uniref:hypothetical protein n=1 Tax=Pedobacter sp. Leaf170 TaxID=2876558 RepID=UPI001E50E112|nr:hypothetical protein [Pedobacter sp. Leaf170]